MTEVPLSVEWRGAPALDWGGRDPLTHPPPPTPSFWVPPSTARRSEKLLDRTKAHNSGPPVRCQAHVDCGKKTGERENNFHHSRAVLSNCFRKVSLFRPLQIMAESGGGGRGKKKKRESEQQRPPPTPRLTRIPLFFLQRRSNHLECNI